jgi:peptide/nickel transport system permease protein
MTKFIIRRLLSMIPVVVGLSVLVFALVHLLPGDPVDMMLAEYGADAARLADLRQKLGLDLPLHMQYLKWAGGIVTRLDFGRSLFSQKPVLQQILSQLPGTLELALAGTVVASVLGVFLGIFAALNANTWIDLLTRVFALIGISVPIFWSGLIVILIFSIRLRWFPAAGTGGIKNLILPALVVGIASASSIARLVRAQMLEVMREDYIRTARAKGLAGRVVIWRHAFRNTLIPIITIVGLGFGYSLGGTVVTETVFARKGLGLLAIEAILKHDVAVVEGSVLFIALVFVVVNLLVDVSYAALDPRIRLADDF